jgi:hydrogenase expression/formation protein HypD
MKDIVEAIHSLCERIPASGLSLMEVCGTHTMAIWRHGVRPLLPPKVRLVSGPGCPVCVTSPAEVDAAIQIARRPDAIVVTFGDMIRVPGSTSSLERERAEGADVRVVYSPLGALEIAKANPGKRVVFLAVGFETTAPLTASLVLQAGREGIRNLLIFCAHKVIPPAMEALLADDGVKIDGFLCPGHVSAVIGAQAYEFIPRRFGKPCVVAGFEPADILLSIKMLLQQIIESRCAVEIEYARCVQREGNPKARRCMEVVFQPADPEWRGLGKIPGSGLALRPGLSPFDAVTQLGVRMQSVPEPRGCSCGAVLRGVIAPTKCPLFAKACTPEAPVGPCMVSSEGTCAAFYKYGHSASAL